MGRNRKRNRRWGQNQRLPAQSQPSSQFPSSFRIGEHIGTEDRGTEFKDGQGFIDIDFRASVAKYVSAFVNSHAHGTLFAGVNNAGHVTGYEITQSKEDRLRLQIDEAIKDIKPNIFPNDYSVVFIPVTNQKGDLADGYRTGRYSVVICIDVNGDRINNNRQLYRTLQGTFMRRDAGVQSLDAQDIHEFYQRRNQSEMDRLKNDLKQKNKHKDNEFDKRIREIENKHKQTEEALERERLELLAKTNKLQEEIERFKQQREESVDARGTERNQSEMDPLRSDLKQTTEQKDNEFDRRMRELENEHKQKEESLERERLELLAKTNKQQEEIERFKQQRKENVEVRGAEASKQTQEERRKPSGQTDTKSKLCTIS
ncbi:uncharacterized protein DDB_G0290301-like [Mya arenaria]|uniref:uncharacterized protein DDB_G0290301-like n=1 Tax=Mya arenaria TaxID=6604 RepID=UPI0022E8F3FE|nr:uncharacterized protein DDB_G0290301-like [Mya arenaria]XP_052765622.1 uncharacterized protein DDB_G0290301-like [Mya arenaria]